MTTQTYELEITASRKLAIRKLFSKAFGFSYIAGVSTIRLQFSNFNPSSPIHWVMVADRAIARLQEIEDQQAEADKIFQFEIIPTPLTANEIHYEFKQAIALTDTYTEAVKYDDGFNAPIKFGRYYLGQVGYSKSLCSWFFQYGEATQKIRVDSAAIAFSYLIVKFEGQLGTFPIHYHAA